MMWRYLYTLLFHLLLPVVIVRLWWRGGSERGYRQNIGERFGLAGASLAKQNVIWIHAVSVGEVRAALPLIGKLRKAFADRPMVLTCMTPTGRRTARSLLPDDVDVRYLPYDLPWAHALFITRHQPTMLIVMETELWPNALAACRRHQVPAFLFNARMSEKSQRGYLKYLPGRALAREALRGFTAVMAQSADDAARLATLGATAVMVTGNVKFDVIPDDAAIALGMSWRAQSHNRKVILLASTRDQEELPLVKAFLLIKRWPDGTRPLLVVVPRHPSRCDLVQQQIQHTGLSVRRRSAGIDATSLAKTDVLLGDSMGEMQAFYALCDVAIIGGSFQALGGQNLIEAAALGKPVIMGPSTFNFSEAVTLARAADALQSVADADGAMEAACVLLGDAGRLAAIGANARAFAGAHGGATARTVALIQANIN